MQRTSTTAPDLGSLAQLPPFTNVVASPAPPTSQPRRLDAATIDRRITSVARKDANPMQVNTYWQVAQPSRELKLTGAQHYVSSSPVHSTAQGNNRFVYWPRYRVAGTINDIVSQFKGTGDPRFASLTAETVRKEAIDPLNPDHQAEIDAVKESVAGKSDRAGGFTLEDYIAVGEALKARSSGGSTTTTTSGGRRGRAPSGGQRQSGANRGQARLISDFNRLMADALAEVNLPKILNVSAYDGQTFTKALRTTPPTGGRSTAIRPIINVGGKSIQVPIMARPGGESNFENYVDQIVRQSDYAQYADAILNSFHNISQGRQAAPAPVSGLSGLAIGSASPNVMGQMIPPQRSSPRGGSPRGSISGLPASSPLPPASTTRGLGTRGLPRLDLATAAPGLRPLQPQGVPLPGQY